MLQEYEHNVVCLTLMPDHHMSCNQRSNLHNLALFRCISNLWSNRSWWLCTLKRANLGLQCTWFRSTCQSNMLHEYEHNLVCLTLMPNHHMSCNQRSKLHNLALFRCISNLWSNRSWWLCTLKRAYLGLQCTRFRATCPLNMLQEYEHNLVFLTLMPNYHM